MNIGTERTDKLYIYSPYYQNLPANFGLPPYHFRCRTEVVPVWINEEEVDGVKMKYTQKEKDDVIRHIDKLGIERRLTKQNYYEGNHSSPIYKKAPKKDIIKALNSIEEIAPHSKISKYTCSKSSNGYYLVFEANEIVTAYKPEDRRTKKSNLKWYFEQNALKSKREIIKWTPMALVLKNI